MAFARRARRAVLPVATKFHGAFCMGAAQRDFSGACTAEWVRAKNAARRVRPAAVANFSRAAARLARQAVLHPRQFHQTSRAQRARLQAARIMVFARRARRAICRLPRSFTTRFAWTRRSGILPAIAQRSGCERSPALPGRETHRPRACLEKEKTCNGGGRSAGFSEACAGFVAQSPEFAAP